MGALLAEGSSLNPKGIMNPSSQTPGWYADPFKGAPTGGMRYRTSHQVWSIPPAVGGGLLLGGILMRPRGSISPQQHP